MIDLSPEAGKLIKSMYEKIHALMTENQYLRSQLLSKGTTMDLNGLVSPVERETGAMRPDLEDMSGPFMGLDMDDLEPDEDDSDDDQVLHSLFAEVL